MDVAPLYKLVLTQLSVLFIWNLPEGIQRCVGLMNEVLLVTWEDILDILPSLRKE